MTRAEIKERLFRWVAVPALAVVLALVALLQYRWSGQVSAAARAQMQSNLQVSLTGFRQDFGRELGAACLEIRTALDTSSTVQPQDLKEQFQHWQQTSAHPNLVTHIYVWQDPANHPQPLRFDPGRDQFERASWPQEFDPLRQHLQEISAMAAMHSSAGAPGRRRPRNGAGMQGFRGRDHFGRNGNADPHRGMHGRGHLDFFLPWAVDQSIPALVYPIRQRSTPDQPADVRSITWLVIELNKNVLEKEVFPELAQKYFRGAAGLDYHVAVREGGKEAGQVIYASDSGFGGDPNLQMDGSLNLLGPPFGRAGDTGFEFLLAPVRQGPSDQTSSDDRRGPGPERSPRFEPFNHSGDHSVWQVVAKHKSGSVEAAVSGLRRRNLMASFGVLMVLGVTMALILIASQRARRLARLQMDFVAGVSHELRTPLAVISSAAENIADGVVEDKQQLMRYGKSLVKQSRQLTHLVEQVLLFASTQQTRPRYESGAVDLADIVDAALEGTSSAITAAGVSVERVVEPGLPAVTADAGRLVQCLQNLITNAVKYGGENHWLRVRAAAVREKSRIVEVAVTVEDHGIGISKDDIRHIFEPFYRSPAVAESGIHGTGLGLPLARNIVEAMGGRLTAESELGKGSAFTIHLQPAERGLEEKQRAPEPQAGPEPDFSA
ncbi:MAG TPA: HAMP domain-containing sensor histidine kinase [Candidatus Angelobacter sp.]|nr:HAMP domain-containing sensor histidine kinase [Candidatus Angelobacter sp.]